MGGSEHAEELLLVFLESLAVWLECLDLADALVY